MKNEFKVGDRVRGTSKSSNGAAVGKVGKIIAITGGKQSILVEFDEFVGGHDGNNCCTQGKDGHCWWCNPYEIELVTEGVIIHRDNNEVIAMNVLTGEKAIARCHPDDPFNFDTGVKLAIERLFEPKLLNTTILVTRACYGVSRGKIYDIVNGQFRGDNGKIYPPSRKFKCIDDVYNYFTPDVKFVEIKKVHREARAGEFVLITSAKHTNGHYANGDILKVIDHKYRNARYKNEPGCGLWVSEYVVLEGYVDCGTHKKFDEPIKPGDEVKVVDIGCTCSTFIHWEGLKGYSSHFVPHKQPVRTKTYKVLNIEKHGQLYDDDLFALIQDPDTTQVFIVAIAGLKKC